MRKHYNIIYKYAGHNSVVRGFSTRTDYELFKREHEQIFPDQQLIYESIEEVEEP